jgi:pilus assembly protein TadC
MIVAAVCAVLLAGGLLCCYRALSPARPPLAAELARLLDDPPTGGTGPQGAHATVSARLEQSLLPRLVSRWPALRAHLAVTEFTLGGQLLRAAGTGALFAAMAGGVVVIFAAVGFALPAGIAVLGVVLIGAGGLAAPFWVARGQADERRGELRGLLPGYLDVAQVLLAAGQSSEAALRGAAAVGEGWGYTRLRRSLEHAAIARKPAADALAELGRRTGVDELVEIADTLSVAAGAGTAVRASLAARAASLREHALSDAEAKAGKASEGMAFPLVCLVGGFAVLIGYPAIAGISAGL